MIVAKIHYASGLVVFYAFAAFIHVHFIHAELKRWEYFATKIYIYCWHLEQEAETQVEILKSFLDLSFLIHRQGTLQKICEKVDYERI